MRFRASLAIVAAAVSTVALFVPTSASAAPFKGQRLLPIRTACALVQRVGFSHCNMDVLATLKGVPNATAAPSGYGAADLQSAYGVLNSAAGGGRTVAIVDAYDDKTAEADLGVYRSQFGLSPCTTANGCFRKVNQNGVQGSYPSNNAGWGLEISLDLDMVSAICPKCHILLVEATNNQNANLYAAVDTAAGLGANVISNSYGGAETATETSDDVHFNHPGIAITVSSGDSGYGPQYPAASPYVTAVGGTSLTKSGSTFTETAWSGAGSGCSAYERKPSWQADSGCANRTIADVSAVADPNTGVAVYDSNCNFFQQLVGQCFKGWGVVGGTSASAPIIGGMYALAGNTAPGAIPSVPAQLAYGNTGSLHDVTSGSNGSCGGSYLCTAGPGYDGPTGLGTPSGTGAF
jgi:subtilase family serine protease